MDEQEERQRVEKHRGGGECGKEDCTSQGGRKIEIQCEDPLYIL